LNTGRFKSYFCGVPKDSPPAGLEMRPVNAAELRQIGNDASASTASQSGEMQGEASPL